MSLATPHHSIRACKDNSICYLPQLLHFAPFTFIFAIKQSVLCQSFLYRNCSFEFELAVL